MKLSEIKHNKKPYAIKHSVADSPHFTIETNRSCNIKCRSCYNLNNTFIKDYDEIITEIDLGIQKRNVLVITIMGGEPTLHPKLAEIIRYVKSKNIICQLLTNGIKFLKDSGDKLLDEVIAAGLDKVILHIDEGQVRVHKDIDKVTHTLLNKFEKRRLVNSLSNTIFYDTQGLIPEKIRRYAKYRYFDGVLGLLSRNYPESVSENRSVKNRSELTLEYESILKELDIDPVAYIPTNLEDEEISWLFYFFYINSNTGQTFARSGQLVQFFSTMYKFITGKNMFGINFTPFQFYLVFFASSIAELVISPKRIGSLLKLMKNSNFLDSLRIHTLVLQNPPQYNFNKKEMQICYHCPDATIRNGKLTPLCLADYINPLKEFEISNEEVPAGLREMVYEHMNEID